MLTVGALIHELKKFHESDLVILEHHKPFTPQVFVAEIDRVHGAHTHEGYRVILQAGNWRKPR